MSNAGDSIAGLPFNSSTKRHLSFDDEFAKYQWWLQKTLKEKRDLELLND